MMIAPANVTANASFHTNEDATYIALP
jgi:hypothetical protein